MGKRRAVVGVWANAGDETLRHYGRLQALEKVHGELRVHRPMFVEEVQMMIRNAFTKRGQVILLGMISLLSAAVGIDMISSQSGNLPSSTPQDKERLPRLAGEVVTRLPISMLPIEGPALYERKLPFYQYGPWSYAVDEERKLAYIPDDQKRCILVVNWEGKVVKQLKAPSCQSRYSDVVLFSDKLYVGCAEEERVFVFDLRSGEVEKDLRISRRGYRFRGFTGRAEISRVGRDHKGHLFAAISPVGEPPRLVVMDEKSGKLTMTYSSPDWNWGVHRGVAFPNGEWFFTRLVDVQLGQGRYAPITELYKLTPDGRPQSIDGVRKDGWDVTQVVGFDALKRLYLIAVNPDLKPGTRSERVPMLLCLDTETGHYRVLGWCDADSGILRAPGARHAIVTPSGHIYFIIRLTEKVERDKPVDFALARLVSR